MTNQQGAPEALRLAESLERRTTSWTDKCFAAAELRRLHALTEIQQQELISESHRTAEQKLRADQMTRQHADQAAMNREARAKLAALVDAQQPATHVQNPAGIEHVAGDVSKNEPESNMAQQPAPSAASKAVLAAIRAANMQLVRTGDDEFMLVTYKNAKAQCDGGKCGIGGYCDDCPTPQADIQPVPQGETNVQLDTDSNHSAPGQQRDVAGSVALGQPVGNGSDQAAGHTGAQGDKLLIVAERNIRSFLRSAVFKSESDREAALNCVDVLWEAARAPADSVTAPAGCEVAGWQMVPIKPTHDMLCALSGEWHPSRHQPERYAAMLAAAPTPPAQAADSVREDAETALRKVLGVVQRYLPPDGPSAHDSLSEIIEIVDPWPLGPLEKP